MCGVCEGGYRKHMMIRWSVLFVGVVALAVGVVGLVSPVSAGPANVRCGSAVAQDLSAARQATVLGGANMPGPPAVPETPGLAEPHDDIIVNTDYVSLCRKDLTDRRIWTIALVGVGAIAVLGIGLAAVLSGRSRRERAASQSADTLDKG